MRGEYVWCGSMFGWGLELPPRARRIHLRAIQRSGAGGTTSACAENTPGGRGFCHCDRNYLRVRGEYRLRTRVSHIRLELPPRARRILRKSLSVRMGIGTTSACAENTPTVQFPRHRAWNYLRVRGEYYRLDAERVNNMELPPRARRIRDCARLKIPHQGTTSACAENTGGSKILIRSTGNYLRVRGEYVQAEYAIDTCSELPPRARRIP